MKLIVGVDGCKGSWLAVSQRMSSTAITASIHATPKDLVASFLHADVIAVDVPIGLTDRDKRACDTAARKLLGSPRSSSVFPAPIRPVLDAATREEASEIGRATDGRGVGCQSWGIFKYVKMWDELIRQDALARNKVFEVHPEVCFYEMNGRRPIQNAKKKTEGAVERRNLLNREFGISKIEQAHKMLEGGRFALDDFYDALAALWSARRIANAQAVRLPPSPQYDSFHLPITIWY